MLIEPWHWLDLGLVLIILELFLTSFVSLSIGVAAIVVAVFSCGYYRLAGFLADGMADTVGDFTIIGFKFIKPLYAKSYHSRIGFWGYHRNRHDCSKSSSR